MHESINRIAFEAVRAKSQNHLNENIKKKKKNKSMEQ